MPRLNYVCHRNLITRVIIRISIFSLETSAQISSIFVTSEALEKLGILCKGDLITPPFPACLPACLALASDWHPFDDLVLPSV